MTADPRGVVDGAFARLEGAWNEGDGAAFAAVFTADADFVDIRGSHHTGSRSIAGGHQAIFDTIYLDSRMRYETVSATDVAPGCILAVVTATLDAPSGPLQGVHQSTITALLSSQDGAGTIRALQNTLVVT